MKSVILSLVAGLAILAVPAVAQEEGTTYPATGETVQEERTNPDVGSKSPDSGLTLSGTVVSFNDEQLVLKTATGVEHIVLNSQTIRPSSFTTGELVSVDYTRSTQNGVMIAKQVRLGGASTTTESVSSTTTSNLNPTAAPVAPATGTVDTESELEQDVEEAVAEVGETADEVGAELSEVDDAVEEEVEEAVGSSIDNDGAIGNADDTAEAADTDTDTEALPATGSKAPLAALLGLLALGVAAGLRRL